MNLQSLQQPVPRSATLEFDVQDEVTQRRGIRLPLPPMAARKVARGAKGHFPGQLVFGEGQATEVESHTEMLVALVMLARPSVVGLESQVPFRWVDADNVWHTHFFDFRVTLDDGSRRAIMVKASKTLEKMEFWEAARLIAGQVSPDFTERVCVMSSKHLDPVEVYNAELIHSVRPPDPEGERMVRHVLKDVCGSVLVSDIVDAAGLGGRAFRAVVRMIWNRELELVRNERIDHGSHVRWRAARADRRERHCGELQPCPTRASGTSGESKTRQR
ncbi:hypothetical protein [Pseudooceanicola sp.]|uniref:hypothetical protein n=1 Tax=Pseudooceanicola sp. TaxID=1914328 RepID=UPI00351574BB